MAARFVYLHGFASGPASRKARFFRERLGAAGVEMEAPDLNGCDFEHLTIGTQLRIVEELLHGEPATLIGSSMGGYVAALYASRHPEVERLILLAPAFRFAQHWGDLVGAEALERWRATGSLSVFHYAEQRMRPLSYAIVEDSPRWDLEPGFPQEGHIFHGLRDTVVPARLSEEYVTRHPHVRFTLLDSDHELTDAMETIWTTCRYFFNK